MKGQFNMKILSLVIVLVLIIPVLAGPALRDGFVLSGVDGKLVRQNNKWFFQFERDVSDGFGLVKAGQRLEMLNSAGLEKMIANANERLGATYRLFNAMVTRYKNKNYIFCDFFLPVSEPVKSPQPEQQGESTGEVPINEPNDVVTIPPEIIQRLQARRVIQPEVFTGQLELKQDSILADRIGFITKADGRYKFVFDALGRNVSRVSLELLPCRVLERIEAEQAVDPELRRYRISGIVTKYKDNYYLLLRRAVRAYSYGNFGS